jgi:hypothetical protein
VWLEDAQTLGYSQPPIVAQDQAADLMRLFQQTGPLMELLIAIQFAQPIVVNNIPLPITLPTSTFSDNYTVYGSQRLVQLFSAPSETPCSIAAWIPDVQVLYSGPAGLCVEPNLGMPLWPTGNGMPTRPLDPAALVIEDQQKYRGFHNPGNEEPLEKWPHREVRVVDGSNHYVERNLDVLVAALRSISLRKIAIISASPIPRSRMRRMKAAAERAPASFLGDRLPATKEP